MVALANDLMTKHGIYVQPINYPTVPRGSELLRVAPTPHHTRQMMGDFVRAVRSVWMNNGLELKSDCGIECEFCKQPVKFEALASREHCNGRDCDRYLLNVAA